MINGLHVDFTTDELKAHLNERAVYHANKGVWYDQKVKDLRAGGLQAEPNVTNDPTSSLESSAKSHKDKASFFRIMADHLVPNETYRLDQNDLIKIDIVSRWF